MKVFRLALYASGLVFIGFAILVFLSGQTLVVENATSSQVLNVTVEYGRGSVSFPVIPANNHKQEFVGKIGEGATFNIEWEDIRGIKRGAKIQVYFWSTEMFSRLRIVMNDNGQVDFYEADRMVEAVEQW